MDYTLKWKAERERKAFLALDDGTVLHGVAFGAKKDALGEVVFNTGMSGYQEILTDPSYAGQFVTLTTAEVGNYGINGADIESRALFLSGLVIGDLTEPSNWRSEKSLDEYLAENGVPGIYGVDTRALTLHIREHGNRKAFLCVGRGTRPACPRSRGTRDPAKIGNPQDRKDLKAQLGLTNGQSRAAVALKLVSTQKGGGWWLVETNAAPTRLAIEILKGL